MLQSSCKLSASTPLGTVFSDSLRGAFFKPREPAAGAETLDEIEELGCLAYGYGIRMIRGEEEGETDRGVAMVEGNAT